MTAPSDVSRPQLVPSGEWVGGVLSTPFIIEEGGQRLRAKLAIWYELPADKIVGQKMLLPGDDAGDALASVLREALRAPAWGPQRRPAAIRMSQEDLLPPVREIVGDDMIVRLNATPELDDILESMAEAMAEPDSGARPMPGNSIAGGKHPDDLVEALFRAAQMLHAVAPWKKLGEAAPLRLDIESLDINGACLVVIGVLGESRGFLLYPSLEHYERFREHCNAEPGRIPDDVATPLWSFTLDRIADLTEEYCQEFADHGRDPIGGDSYPVLERRDRHSMPTDLTDEDLRVAAATASALSSFVVRCGDRITSDAATPQSESFANNNGPVVRLTYPYEAFDGFEALSGEEGPGEASQPDFGDEPDWMALEDLVGSRGIGVDFMYGVLTAAASHPSMSVGPGDWLPLLLGPEPLAGGEDPQVIMSLALNAYNSTVERLGRGDVLMPEIDEREELGEWCQGYARVMSVEANWVDDDVARRLMAPVLVLAGEEFEELDPAKVESFIEGGGPAVMEEVMLELHARFRELRVEEMGRRHTPARKKGDRVGRNDPCPCGSGRKYKKCCLGR